MTVRGWLVALAALSCAACGPEGKTPAQAVEAYFVSLKEDPVRTLVLLEPELVFQAGFRIASDGSPDAGDPELAQIRADLGWLALVKLRSYRNLASGLSAEIVSSTTSESGAEAQVTARVALGHSPAFTQHFDLVREPGVRGWRIRAIQQTELGATSGIGAYAAAPTRAGARQLRILSGVSDTQR